MDRSRGQTENRRVSATVRTGGHTVATGPLVVGAVHDATGGWTVPLLVILGAVAVWPSPAGGRTGTATGGGADAPADDVPEPAAVPVERGPHG